MQFNVFKKKVNVFKRQNNLKREKEWHLISWSSIFRRLRRGDSFKQKEVIVFEKFQILNLLLTSPPQKSVAGGFYYLLKYSEKKYIM